MNYNYGISLKVFLSEKDFDYLESNNMDYELEFEDDEIFFSSEKERDMFSKYLLDTNQH